MIPYFVVYSYIIISLLIEEFEVNNKNNYNIFKTFNLFSFNKVFFVLFIFASFRGNGNGDYFNYINGVGYVTSLDFLFNPIDYPFEFGFRVLSFLSNILNFRPQFVIFSMNFISFSFIYLFVSKRSQNKLLSLLIFFPIMLQFDMHHSRSAVAMSSGLMFFDSIIEKKYKKSFLFFIVAFSFHKSSIVLLVLYLVKPFIEFVEKRKYDMKKIILLTVIISFIIVALLNPLNIFINIFNNPVTNYIYRKLKSYLMNERWSYEFNLWDPRLLLSIFMLLYFTKFYSKIDRIGKSYIIIQLISVISMLFLRQSTILVMRVYNFFNIFLIVSLPYFFQLKNCTQLVFIETTKINRKSLEKIIIIGYIIYTIILITMQVPYKMFFQ